MQLTLTDAERLVAKLANAEWCGWTIHLYQPHPGAYMRKNGSFFGGQWCVKTSVTPNNEGNYDIPNRYIKGFRA